MPGAWILRKRNMPDARQFPVVTRWLTPGTLLLLALALRVPTLGSWSVWIDEAITVEGLRGAAPPYVLHYLLARPLLALLGDSEWALRVQPCAFGVATVWLLARLRPPGVAPAVPLVAALLLASASWHVFMSQNARAYAGQGCFVLIAFAASAGWLRGSGLRHLGTGTAAFALAVASHPAAIFQLPGLLWVAWPRIPRRARGWLLGLGGVLFACAAWAYLPGLDEYLRQKGRGSALQLVTSYGFLAGPVLLLAAAVGAVGRGRTSPELRFLAAGAAAYLAGSQVLFLTGYHAFGTLPVGMLLAARGLHACSRTRAGQVLAALLALQTCVWLVLYHTSHGMRPRWREAAQHAAAAARDGHAVFATQVPALAYYLPGTRVHGVAAWQHDDLERALAGPVWLAVHPDDVAVLAPAERARLQRIVAGRMVPVAELPCRFGPKEMTLTLHRDRP